ncbi:L,D-transpeptidase family protein [Thalassococcus lentus]|uniref:L,D-transpeptidase n=1 Tax=Thalassococcus lentus TaxID=1210524 RepID=A0ABT4XNJ2_9RHOB|nr:L,D-transpeptidase [Thalassococcus lentus]MDA7423433.1 L,D-transpeptidase [Thalassococcus lentus]
MRFIKFLSVLILFAGLSACSKIPVYTGPAVTQIVVNKGAREMFLLHHGQVLERYDIGLGFAPIGDKKVRGDGKTPEGDYRIDRRNPNSAFYLSLGIDYPRPEDIAEAKAMGKNPGGDIFIHGRANKNWRQLRKRGRDWTIGCIAVTNAEMRQIYSMVRNGTPIRINP